MFINQNNNEKVLETPGAMSGASLPHSHSREPGEDEPEKPEDSSQGDRDDVAAGWAFG